MRKKSVNTTGQGPLDEGQSLKTEPIMSVSCLLVLVDTLAFCVLSFDSLRTIEHGDTKSDHNAVS